MWFSVDIITIVLLTDVSKYMINDGTLNYGIIYQAKLNSLASIRVTNFYQPCSLAKQGDNVFGSVRPADFSQLNQGRGRGWSAFNDTLNLNQA